MTDDKNLTGCCGAEHPKTASSSCCGGTRSEEPCTLTEENPDLQGSASCCSGLTKERSEEEVRDLIHRLSRIEGQIRGLKKMVEGDAYCIDILTQVSAASSAMHSFSRELLSRHIRSCVTDDIRSGGEDKVNELLRVLPKLMK